METQKKIIGRCPLCGGNVVKTCKGYRCEHNLGDHPSCVLNINGIIGNRKMYDAEIAELLEKRCIPWTVSPPRRARHSQQFYNWLTTATS